MILLWKWKDLMVAFFDEKQAKTIGLHPFFLKAVFSKVLTEDAEGATTYSVQYYAHSKSALETYQTQYAQELQSKGLKRFGDKMLSFQTALEFIDEYTVNKTP